MSQCNKEAPSPGSLTDCRSYQLTENKLCCQCLIDWVKVLRPTWHKIGHFRDVPQPISCLGVEILNLTQQKHAFTNMYYNTKNTKKLKPGLVASYDIRPRNRVLAVYKSVTYLLTYPLTWLVAWNNGRTSVFGWRTFLVLRLTCSWWVTTYVGKPSAIGQPTRQTQPFIPSGLINE